MFVDSTVKTSLITSKGLASSYMKVSLSQFEVSDHCIFQSRAHCVDVDQHPFEVNETGWGEFQIQIKIIFQDPSQRPLTINHHLRLYPPDDAGQLKTSKPVLSEFYDEIV